ncbi:MAG TPA: universal stress protein [Blastocatellia bacterium]|nr:universal stress protein [Blastocatellia bacterium]
MVTNARITFQRILCPTDLTADSNEGLRYGIALARAYEAKLVVCHCVEAAPLDGSPDCDDAKKLIEDMIKQHIRLPQPTPLDWECVVLKGDPATAIANEAAERRIDLIVMRSRRRPLAAALLGSVAESISRIAPCPVLVTHAHEHEWAGLSTNEIDLGRIAVAYDFSTDSELALSYALSLAQEYQAEMHLVHVLPPQPKHDAPEIARLPQTSEIRFSEVAGRLQSAIPAEAALWCEVKHSLREGQPYRELLDYVEDNNIDLICIGATGTGFGMRSLFGSNADRVLRQALCPVLIARPLRPAYTTAQS